MFAEHAYAQRRLAGIRSSTGTSKLPRGSTTILVWFGLGRNIHGIAESRERGGRENKQVTLSAVLGLVVATLLALATVTVSRFWCRTGKMVFGDSHPQ